MTGPEMDAEMTRALLELADTIKRAPQAEAPCIFKASGDVPVLLLPDRVEVCADPTDPGRFDLWRDGEPLRFNVRAADVLAMVGGPE